MLVFLVLWDYLYWLFKVVFLGVSWVQLDRKRGMKEKEERGLKERERERERENH